MKVIYDKILAMRYCKKCRGSNMAQVRIIAKQYGTDTYNSYTTVSCPCSERTGTVSNERNSGKGTQMQIL